MTDARWADAIAHKAFEKARGPLFNGEVQALLLKEHARAIRIVKAEIKRVELDQHTYTAGFKMTLLKELQSLLSKFERGRGGKG